MLRRGLRPASYIPEMDQRCPRGHRPAHTTAAKVQTQGSSMKDPRTEEPKEKNSGSGSGSALQRIDAEPSKKEKKRKWQQHKKNANVTDPAGGSGNANRNSKKRKRGPEKGLSNITCFNTVTFKKVTMRPSAPSPERALMPQADDLSSDASGSED